MSTPRDEKLDLTEDVAAVMRIARVVFAVVAKSVARGDDALTLTQLRTLALVATSPVPVTLSTVRQLWTYTCPPQVGCATDW